MINMDTSTIKAIAAILLRLLKSFSTVVPPYMSLLIGIGLIGTESWNTKCCILCPNWIVLSFLLSVAVDNVPVFAPAFGAPAVGRACPVLLSLQVPAALAAAGAGGAAASCKQYRCNDDCDGEYDVLS